MKTNLQPNKISVVIAQGGHRIQAEMWNKRKEECKTISLKVGKKIKLSNVSSVRTEVEKAIYTRLQRIPTENEMAI